MSIGNKIRIKIERAIVAALLEECSKAGFRPVKVWDGGEYVATPTAEEAIAAVFSVDESWLYFEAIDETARACNRGVFLVGGNGTDIISDYHCKDEAFTAAVERACKRAEAFSVTC